MKKLLTLIAITSAIIPAIHGMDTNLPAGVQTQYDNLTVFIKNADVDGFKQAFDTATLPAENIAALRQTVAETKTAITNELEAMGNTTKNWSKITKGGLATIGGFWAGISIPTALYLCNTIRIYSPNMSNAKKYAYTLLDIGIVPFIPSDLTCMVIQKMLGIKKIKDFPKTIRICVLATNMIACLGVAYKGLTYGPKIFKAGLNYKEHLQNMLANLDAIDAHITQSKA